MNIPAPLKLASNPAPSPIVPKEPKASVNLFTPVNKLFNKLTAPFSVSELTMFSTVSVQVLLNLLSEPVRLLDDFSASLKADPLADVLLYKSSIF